MKKLFNKKVIKTVRKKLNMSLEEVDSLLGIKGDSVSLWKYHEKRDLDPKGFNASIKEVFYLKIFTKSRYESLVNDAIEHYSVDINSINGEQLREVRLKAGLSSVKAATLIRPGILDSKPVAPIGMRDYEQNKSKLESSMIELFLLKCYLFENNSKEYDEFLSEAFEFANQLLKPKTVGERLDCLVNIEKVEISTIAKFVGVSISLIKKKIKKDTFTDIDLKEISDNIVIGDCSKQDIYEFLKTGKKLKGLSSNWWLDYPVSEKVKKVSKKGAFNFKTKEQLESKKLSLSFAVTPPRATFFLRLIVLKQIQKKKKVSVAEAKKILKLNGKNTRGINLWYKPINDGVGGKILIAKEAFYLLMFDSNRYYSLLNSALTHFSIKSIEDIKGGDIRRIRKANELTSMEAVKLINPDTSLKVKKLINMNEFEVPLDEKTTMYTLLVEMYLIKNYVINTNSLELIDFFNEVFNSAETLLKPTNFGERLQFLANAKKVSRSLIVKECKVTRQAVSKWFLAKKPLSIKLCLCRLLNESEQDLYDFLVEGKSLPWFKAKWWLNF